MHIHYPTGTRSINIVAIAAGSAGGGFMLLLVTIVLSGTCLILKRKDYINLPTTSKVRVEVDEIVTNTNVAYKPVQQTATVQAVNPHELNVTYDTAGQQGEGTTDHEPQQAEATENRASTDDAQISLTSNVAYHKFAKPLQENDHTYDQYDYI